MAVSGKPHPLESVSRQLDPIDLDDDWGLQEVRATTDVITEGNTDTITMTTNTTNALANAGDSSALELRRESGIDGNKQRETETPNTVNG